MDLEELKQRVDFEKFLIFYGYRIRKEKSCRNWRAYTNGVETVLLHDYNDIKLYFKPDADRGSIIDFCLQRPELTNQLNGSPMVKIKQLLGQFLNEPDFEITLLDIKMREMKLPFSVPSTFRYAEDKAKLQYLHSRNINDDVLKSTVFSNIGLLSERGYTNVAFPIYNKNREICGLDIRNYNFKSFVDNSDKSHGIWLSNFEERVDEIVIGESPIDMLSYHQLWKQGQQSVLYIATCGTLTLNGLINILSIVKDKKAKTQNLKIHLAFDNDYAGSVYTNKVAMSLLEDKAMYPIFHDKNFRRYINISNVDLISRMKDHPDIILQNEDSHYTMIYRDDINIIRQISQIALQCKGEYVSIDLPETKDFNDDLNIRAIVNSHIQNQTTTNQTIVKRKFTKY